MTPAMPVSQTNFRNAMALMTGAVNVITTAGVCGHAGFTASAVCSVTDQPPTLLVCMNRSSFAHRFFANNGVLCVNVLSSRQEAVSARFSDRSIPMDERFEQTPWSVLHSGSPALDGCLANFDARIVQMHEVGTHTIFYAELLAIRSGSASGETPTGLAYFNRLYHHLGGEANAA